MINYVAHWIRSAFFRRALLVAASSAFLLVAVSIGRAQEPDTAAPEQIVRSEKKDDEAQKKRRLTLKVQADDEAKEVAKNIIIDEEGITINGKKYHYGDLEDSIVSSLVVESGSISKFGEPVMIAEDEIVDGDLFSLGGDVTVAGTVNGDVAIIGADLHLLSSGIIKGDVFTFGGTIHQEPGGQIRGQRAGILSQDFHIYTPFIVHPINHLITFGLPLLFFVIISFLFLTLAGFFVPNHVERIGKAIEVAPLKSMLMGFAALVLALPLFLLLCVTIIGIPVALIAQPIAYFVAGIMGFAGVSFFVGMKLQRGTSLNPKSPLSRILLGALIIEAALILAWFFTLGGRPFAPLFWLFYLIGWIVYLVAIMIGLGAVIWTRFGIRPIAVMSAEVPPVPPSIDADRSEDEPGAPASS